MLGQDEFGLEDDVPMAEAVRSNGKHAAGDMETPVLRVDGIVHHNRHLKVLHPDHAGRFVTAAFRDPKIGDFPNVYTDAASTLGWLKADAKVSQRKTNEIHTIYIVNATAHADPASGQTMTRRIPVR